MKKEILAAALLVLIFAGSLVNLYYLNRLTEELTEQVNQAKTCVESGDWEKAAEFAESATELWANSDSYTHIVLRHSEINSASDAFYELLGGIYAENYGDSIGAARMLLDHIESITKMEEIRFGSIF
jgi:hypothetical protein